MADSKKMHVHFIGIGGIGMSGIAHVLFELGYEVSGSDLRETHLTKRLSEKGIRFFLGHSAKNVTGADVVVVSSAIPSLNPEILEARSQKIPVMLRAEMLAYLMRGRFGIAIAGTHGKTTTTSMVAVILEAAGKDPTVVVGGEVHGLGVNAKLGKSDFIVAEADESDASFLKLSPRIAVVTNIDGDVNPSAEPFALLQFDFAKTMKRIKEIFLEFLQRIPKDGYAILSEDCPHLREIKGDLSASVVTYGLSDGADLVARQITFDGLKSHFDVYLREEFLGKVSLQIPGEHNVLNALAALALALCVQVSFQTAEGALHSFRGVKRRFETLGEAGGILVVDDYAHNPTKIKAALAAAKSGWKRRRIAVFQPHRYTRTKFLKKEFAHAFEDADILFITQIYSAGEEPIAGVTGEALADEIKASYPEKPIYFLQNEKEVVKKLLEVAEPGDIVIMLGAGDIYQVGSGFLKALQMNLPNAS